MSNDLIKTCDDAIGTIEAGGASTEEVCAAVDFVQRLSEVARELKRRVDAAAIDYIQANGEIQIGPRRFYVSEGTKSTKCIDTRKTYEKVMEVAGDNVDAVLDCLCSDPWKPAKTMKLIGDGADKFFETTRKPKLNQEGQPEPVLNVVDQRFIKE